MQPSLDAAEPPRIAPPPRRWRRTFIVLPLLALVHTVLVWGYTGLLWGDHGRWLHEVSRYAGGETVYRDFTWQGPPLGLWVLGTVAKLAGSGLATISLTTSLVFLAVIVSYLLVLRRALPEILFPVALPAFLFAIAYAQRTGTPLPLGTWAPGVPMGVLFLLVAALLASTEPGHAPPGRSAACGGLIGLAALSSADFWLTGVYLLSVSVFLMGRRGVRGWPLLAAPLGGLVTVLAGLVLTALGSGFQPMLISAGHTSRDLALMIVTPPSMERFVVDIAAAAAVGLTAVTALWMCLAINDRSALRWAGAFIWLFLIATALHLGKSVAIARDILAVGPEPMPTLSEEGLWYALQSGRGAVRAAMAFYDERFQAHLFPYILSPALLIVLIARWRKWFDPALRDRLALLLGLCVVARAHRPAYGADWYHVLLELPAFVLFFRLLCANESHKAARAIRVALSVFIMLGLYTYLSLAHGPFTFTGRLPSFTTPQGVVHWPARSVRAWLYADSSLRALDSAGVRPLLAFGATGGWNYYLDRRNPLPVTGGLGTTLRSAESMVERAREANPPVILIDNRYALRSALVRGPAAFQLHWEPRPEQNAHIQRERALFRELRQGCADISADTTRMVRVFDCPRRGETR